MGKKIISFALWGKDPKYGIGAIRNVELARYYFPEWTCRFYVDEASVPLNIMQELRKLPVEIINKSNGDWRGMFWRFEPASEEDVDMMLSRDCDSRLSRRERFAVEEWLESGKSFHIVRDHPQHGAEILGGLWGVRGDKLRNMKQFMSQWNQENRWQTDQEFLRAKIYPLVKDDAFVHDQFHVFNNDIKKTIKFERDNYSFLGEQFDETDRPNQAHREEVKRWMNR